MNVVFCPACRCLILAEFRYCPYCGVSVARGPGLAEALDEPFEKLDLSRPQRRASLFSGVEESLQRLESDMDLILEELEKQGAPPD